MFQEELGGQVSMNCQMTCVCSGRGFIFVGDDAGRVHFLNRRMEVKTLKLFEGDVEQLLQVNSCTKGATSECAQHFTNYWSVGIPVY